MGHPDYEGANQYALRRLEQDLAPVLVYHNLAHTHDDVVPAAEHLASLEGVAGESLQLLRTAAYYHDIGFIEQYAEHEAIGVRIARQVLPHFGYSSEDIRTICGIVLVTRMPQTPHTLLEEIMADADLDVLGRDDFWVKNQALRAERAACVTPARDQEWYSGQLQFLQMHHYFTASAVSRRSAVKRLHIEQLMLLLEQRQGA